MPRHANHPRFGAHDPLLDAPVAATLDLHSQSRLQAEASVKSFLAAAARAHAGKVVHVITGKGKSSARGAVLKPAVRQIIKAAGPIVAEFDADVDGGGFLVRLR